MMKELANITPNNFGIMYCLDVLWKLILVRFELLLEAEDEQREKMHAKAEAILKKKYDAAHF